MNPRAATGLAVEAEMLRECANRTQPLPNDTMGSLQDIAGSSNVTLEPENLIGRSARCGIILTSGLASSIHASLRWTPSGWTIKDLGSTNGSFLNGRRLEAGRAQLMAVGDVLSFGGSESGWKLLDDRPPVPVVVAEDGARASGSDLIPLPSGDRPVVTLYRNAEGTWCIESADHTVERIADGAEIEVTGKRWRFQCPTLVAQTDLGQRYDVNEIRLIFRVSSDEELVELAARADETTIDLGVRANNYLLLTLARQRAEDRADGAEESSQGWMHQEDVAKALATDPENINVDVFRLRKRFGQYFRNATRIIERRPRTGQLRLGLGSFEIGRL